MWSRRSPCFFPAQDLDGNSHAERDDAPSVLVVEDEILVRMFATDVLEDAGFLVEQAATAGEALSKLQLTPRLSAAVIDLGLPDRLGDELAAEMRAVRGSLPILIASGRSEIELKERFASDTHVAMLMKPYTGSMLLGALEGLGVRRVSS